MPPTGTRVVADGETTFRLSAIAALVYVGVGFGFAVMAVTAFTVATEEISSPVGVPVWLGAIGAVWALNLLPLLVMRCTLSADGLSVRNYFRAYAVPWADITVLATEHAAFLTLEAAWSVYPRCHLRSGEFVDIRALVHMRRKRARAFVEAVEEKADEFGFRANVEAHRLSN
jgi:Bacterial PH domain